MLLITVCTVLLTVSAEAAPVARFGDTGYDSLSAALNAAILAESGGTVEILADTELIFDRTYTISKSIAISGNNHVVTVDYQSPNNGSLFTTQSNGSFIIHNTVLSATSFDDNASPMITVGSGSKVELISSTIRDVNIFGSSNAASVFGVYGTLIMKDSTITNCKTESNCNTILLDGGNLEISGGSITNCGYFGDSPGDFDAGAISTFATPIGGEWSSSSMKIEGTAFTGNAGGCSGAIYIYRATGLVEIKNAVFQNNKGNYAGAVWISGSNAAIENTQFIENKSTYCASLLTDECNSVVIQGGSFVGNTGNYGGAIASDNCIFTLSGTLIKDNRAASYGGAVYAGNNSSLTLSNTIMQDNSADFYGGGVFKSSSSLSLEGNNQIFNNTAGAAGADLLNYDGYIELSSATAMNQTFQDTEFVIDGWYDDTSTRWDYEKALTYGNTYLGDTWSINGQKGFIAAFRAHSVKLSGGANATVSGGDTSQAVQSGAITTVTYTAADGYRFEDFPDIVVNGITAKRISGTVVTVFGTPNENASITIPDAMKKDDAAAVTVVPQIRTLTYSGSAQELVTAGVAEGGTMQYAQGTNDTSVPAEGWGNSIPKGTDAGTYYVWFRVVGDKNHNDTDPACLTATIAKAVPGITAPVARALVYNGSSQELVTAGAAEGGTMQYALGTNDTTAPAEGWSTSIPKGTDAGTYYVWYRVQGDKNHTDIRPVCIIAMVGAEVPKTGDDSSPLLWLGVILVGIMTIGVLRRAGFIGRKQNKGW